MVKSSMPSGWTIKKTIAVVLLIISFLMLFLPWMNIYLNVMGQKFTMAKMLDYMLMMDGTYSESQFWAEMQSELVNECNSLRAEGVYLDPEQTITILRLVAKGKISPFDAARICSFAGNALEEFKYYFAKNSQYLDGSEKVLASMISDAAGSIAFAAGFMWFAVIGSIIAFALSLYFLIKGKKYGVLPYLGFSLLLLIVFVVAISKTNTGIKQLINSFTYIAQGVLSQLGIGYSPNMDFRFFHIGVAGILCFVFAAGAFVLTMLRGDLKVKVPLPAGFPSGIHFKKWTCPSCGAQMSSDASFCSSCGTKRPEALHCPSCGRQIESGLAFCPHCGKRIVDSSPPAPRAETKKCPSCGHSVSADAKVCPSCGHSFDGSAKLWGTLVRPNDDDLD